MKAGDVVVEFDTTELSFSLREAQADLSEAEEQLRQAKAERDAREEKRHGLAQGRSRLRVAELGPAATI